MYDLAKETADGLSLNYPNYTYSVNQNKTILINNKDKIVDETKDDSFFGLGLF